MFGLSVNRVSRSVPNRLAISFRLSPCWMVYSNGPDGVGVIVGVSVFVGADVGVMVGVSVAGFWVAVQVIVGVNVVVGVGVADFNGEFAPNSQKINAAAPAMRRIPAPIMIHIELPCRVWRLRCASITC